MFEWPFTFTYLVLQKGPFPVESYLQKAASKEFASSQPLLARICLSFPSSNSISRSPVNARIGMKEKFSPIPSGSTIMKRRKNESALFPLMSTRLGWIENHKESSSHSQSFSKRFFFYISNIYAIHAHRHVIEILEFQYEIFYQILVYLRTTSTPAFFARFKSDEKDPFTSTYLLVYPFCLFKIQKMRKNVLVYARACACRKKISKSEFDTTF